MRLTKKTFDYVTDITIGQANQNARKTKIPNNAGKFHHIKYYLYNMKVSNFDVKSHSVTFLPKQMMNYKFADIDLSITGVIKIKFAFFHDTAKFEIVASRMSSSVNVKLALDPASGRPTAVVGDCHADVPRTRVIFYKKYDILNLLSNYLSKVIKRNIEKQICGEKTINEINTALAKDLQKMPTSEKFLYDFVFDYRMLKNPYINSTFMDTDHKGEVFWLNNRKECPLPVRPMEPMPHCTTKAMVASQLSAYTLNTFAYVAYKNKYFDHTFDSKNVPKAGLLNTTCENYCIGKLIPELAKVYPNKKVSVLLEATEMPQPNIIKGDFILDGTITLTIYLSTDSPTKPLVILPIKIHTNSTANISKNIVHYSVSVLKLKIGLVKKGLPIKIDVEQLQRTINFGINAFLMPKINNEGHKGFPVPPISKHMKLMNSQFQFGLNSAIFMTDFKFDVNFEQTEDSEDWFSWLIRSIGSPGYYMMSSIANISNFNMSVSTQT